MRWRNDATSGQGDHSCSDNPHPRVLIRGLCVGNRQYGEAVEHAVDNGRGNVWSDHSEIVGVGTDIASSPCWGRLSGAGGYRPKNKGLQS